MKYTLTDLHTHILHAMDDGAENLESAIQMLRREKAGGVERVALTPHFYPQRESLDEFLNRRDGAFSDLQTAWSEDTMPSLRLGAEVRYSPALLDMDLHRLTIGQSNYLLLELSNIEVPVYIERVVDGIQKQGITPILAHVERCIYFRREPNDLQRLVQMGALAQISGKALKYRWDRNFSKLCLEKGLAHIIASDAHNPIKDGGLGDITKTLNRELVERAEEFAKAVWDNECPPAFTIGLVKKGLLGYR